MDKYLKKYIAVVFRYDDLSGDKLGERENDPERRRIFEAERSVDSLFDKFGFPYVVAVIPKRSDNSFAEDPEKITFIKNAVQMGRIEVAQHGFAHINHAEENHRKGEFRERNFDTQLHDIEAGKEILCKSCQVPNITTFVPPWNAWDDNTAKALVESGFSILSADRSYYGKMAAKLTIVPFTAQLWELESLLNCGDMPDSSVIVVLYHPPQIVRFSGQEERYFGLERFENLLRTL